jgi:alpha-L-fucosidase
MNTKIAKKFLLAGSVVILSGAFNVASAAKKNTFENGNIGSGLPGSPEMLNYAAAWSPLNQSAAKEQAREDFNENKYGMFIHWGLYSQLGGIWKGEKMEEGGNGPNISEWIMRKKAIPRDEYATLADTFNPEGFDADEWVAIAKAAGMRYMVITSKHHDGFALFDSEVDSFNAVDATPFGRDIIRELEQACKRAGIAFGVYYSHALDWRDGGDGGMKDYRKKGQRDNTGFLNDFDPSPTSFDDYIENKALPQVRELVANYELTEIWLDTPLYISPAHSFQFYTTIYGADPSILVNERIGNGFGDIGTPGDNVIPDAAIEGTWEGIATTNNSWGYKSYDDDWKSPEETLYWLLENVSKGGNFLLNVGPDGNGVIPAESIENLLAVGKWLEVNGDAIYGSRAWTLTHEGPTKVAMKGTEARDKMGAQLRVTAEDFWFTTKDDKLYVSAIVRPEGRTISIKALKDLPVSKIRVLGQQGKVKWQQIGDAFEVILPKLKDDGMGYTLEISM